MAIAFVLRHPAITAAIIGPRTMEHLESQLTAAGVTLTDDVLDRIDEIVPPGVTINHADNGWVSPALRLRPAAASRLSTGRAGDGVLQVSLRPPQAAERRSSSPAALTDRHPR